jgi:hypothetical protein
MNLWAQNLLSIWTTVSYWRKILPHARSYSVLVLCIAVKIVKSFVVIFTGNLNNYENVGSVSFWYLRSFCGDAFLRPSCRRPWQTDWRLYDEVCAPGKDKNVNSPSSMIIAFVWFICLYVLDLVRWNISLPRCLSRNWLSLLLRIPCWDQPPCCTAKLLLTTSLINIQSVNVRG